jgi:hypothetical protein
MNSTDSTHSLSFLRKQLPSAFWLTHVCLNFIGLFGENASTALTAPTELFGSQSRFVVGVQLYETEYCVVRWKSVVSEERVGFIFKV